MAEQPKQPTIEDLQSQMLALQEKFDTQAAELEKISGENKKLSEDLSKARELNTKLYLRIPVAGQDNQESEPENIEDSFDKLVEETLKERVLDKYRKPENKN